MTLQGKFRPKSKPPLHSAEMLRISQFLSPKGAMDRGDSFGFRRAAKVLCLCSGVSILERIGVDYSLDSIQAGKEKARLFAGLSSPRKYW